ncbi:hypothetical protein L0F63_001806, partial [Massospora cicadina]
MALRRNARGRQSAVDPSRVGSAGPIDPKVPPVKLSHGRPDFSQIDWRHVAMYFPTKSSVQCKMHFFTKLIDVAREELHLCSTKRGRWSSDEIKTLVSLVKQYHSKWALVSMHMGRRTPVQCKNRWDYYKRINLKGKDTKVKPKQILYTPLDDEAILRMYRLLGNRWDLMIQSEPSLASR